ncbi:response regulator [Pararhizobium sp. BT-229]|uniref:response regulator n=1 Tax=Pararhizobium sp. BT-229 TaxID=2986923 RepID=UPI003557B2A5
MMAVDLVEDAGFVALEAAHAEEAMRILERRTDICVVFTDIDMPGSMDGMMLAAAVQDRWSPIEIVIVSGHAAPEWSELPERSAFFSKPYNTSKVTATLHRMATQ